MRVGVDDVAGEAMIQLLEVTQEQLDTEDFPMMLNECTISKKSIKLVGMAHQILQEACGSTNEYGIQCIQTAKDILQLPIALEGNGANLSDQLKMVFHNDGLYLAHHCQFLRSLYKDSFPVDLHEPLHFVSLAASIKLHSLRLRQLQIRAAIAELYAPLSDLNGFINIDREREATKVYMQASIHGKSVVVELHPLLVQMSKAIAKMEYALQSMSNVWRSVVAESLYTEMISTVLTYCLTEIVQRVLSLKEISVGRV